MTCQPARDFVCELDLQSELPAATEGVNALNTSGVLILSNDFTAEDTSEVNIDDRPDSNAAEHTGSADHVASTVDRHTGEYWYYDRRGI